MKKAISSDTILKDFFNKEFIPENINKDFIEENTGLFERIEINESDFNIFECTVTAENEETAIQSFNSFLKVYNDYILRRLRSTGEKILARAEMKLAETEILMKNMIKEEISAKAQADKRLLSIKIENFKSIHLYYLFVAEISGAGETAVHYHKAEPLLKEAFSTLSFLWQVYGEGGQKSLNDSDIRQLIYALKKYRDAVEHFETAFRADRWYEFVKKAASELGIEAPPMA